jgi:hypothetical protein
MFAPEGILQDDLRCRALVGDDKLVLVTVSSDVDDNEVKRRLFKEDHLTASVGIARTRLLTPDSRFSGVLREHIDFCAQYISDTFMTAVLEPLDASLNLLRGGDAGGR